MINPAIEENFKHDAPWKRVILYYIKNSYNNLKLARIKFIYDLKTIYVL